MLIIISKSMSAFVPTVGVPLGNASSFVGGEQAVEQRREKRDPICEPAMMADGEKKKGFNLRKVSLPSVKLRFCGLTPRGFDSDKFHHRARLALWKAVQTVAVARPNRLNQNGSENGIQSDVIKDVDALLLNKSIPELRVMQDEIESRLAKQAEVDPVVEFAEVDFWTAALDKIRSLVAVHQLHECVASLRLERHAQFLRGDADASADGEWQQADGGVRKHDERKKHGRVEMNTDHGRHNMRDVERDMVNEEARRGLNENEAMFNDEVVVESR